MNVLSQLSTYSVLFKFSGIKDSLRDKVVEAGKEDPRKWYAQFSELAMARDTEAERKAPIEMMIALDNWKWMPVRQPLRLYEYSHDKKVKNRRAQAFSCDGDCCWPGNGRAGGN